MTFRKWRGAAGISITVLCLALFATQLAWDNSGQINIFFGITGEANTMNSDYASTEEMRKAEKENEIQTQEEGSVLLFDDGALPLSTTSKVTLLGRTSADNIFRGASGGSATTDDTATSLYEALTAKGYQVNDTVYNALKNSGLTRGRGDIAEVGSDFYTTELTSTFASYSDAAIITLGRYSGEQQDYASGGESNQALVTNDDGDPIDSDGVPMLSLHDEERETIQLAKESGFKKIIVLLNTGAPMDVGEFEELGVDACLWIGYPGYTGFDGVANLLAGEADPSGRLSDTYATNSLSAPAMRNFGTFTFSNEGLAENESHYLVYAEGIYDGYRYYESRYADQVQNKNNATSSKGTYAGETSWNYADEMVYTFGYGISYNTFSEELQSLNWDRENKTVTATVKVRNKGPRDNVNYDGASKDVVELYVSLPYETGEAEKSAIQLIGFAKTKELKSGEEDTVAITVDDYLFSTYDSKATNGADTSKTGCYVFDPGDYYFAVGDDAHDALNNVLASQGVSGLTDADGKSVTGDTQKVKKFTLDTLDNTSHATSDTGAVVSNQFQELDINNHISDAVTYMTRSDWNTYPDRITSLTATDEMLTVIDGHSYTKPSDAPDISSFKYSQKYDTPIKLADMMNVEYDDDETWDKFIDQLTPSQLASLAGEKFGLQGIEELGIPSISSADGPDGIQANAGFSHVSENLATSTFNVDLYEARGKFMAEDGMASGQSGVYGFGANMHRTVYGGRNFEYFSEEPVLAYLAGAVMTKAANSKGLTTYTKHFCANDQEANRGGYCTFMTEETFRSITLKAFEGCFTKGGSMGTMTSNARVGMTVACMSKPLMTTLLREEWGFKGVGMTDSSKGASSIYTKEAVAAGIDQFNNDETRGTSDMKNYLIKEKDGYLWQRAREIAKHYYYMLTKNFVMASAAAGEEVEVSTPWWQTAIIVLDSVLGVCVVAFAGLAITSLVLEKKNKKEA